MPEITARLSTALADRYRIERHLGEGGMATVYLAEDLKHERKVAVKVLRPELAAVLGAERFVQEIKTTANLQHPHILPLFDSGEADSFLYYVMPFIDGETLRDKLNRETQLGIEEAVKITTEVADALDYAHRQNVIHRDIKPENILLHDGRPMVADFGIALAVSAAAGGRMTETGMSLGTPHYMSPEQATAEKELTNRSDIYSLGCVLYELLTGEPPHTGASAQAIVMKIVADEARPVTELRKSVPPHVAAATANALAKLPADRFATAKAFVEALADRQFRYGTETAAAAAAAPERWRHVAVGTSLLAGLAVVLAIWSFTRAPAGSMAVMRQEIAPFASGLQRPIAAYTALAPDGSSMVYAELAAPESWQLLLKRRGSIVPTLLPGTEQARHPVYSPDGEWIAFVAGIEVKKRPIGDGPTVTLAEGGTVGQVGLAWQDDGTILYEMPGPTLMRVAEAGGEADTVAVFAGDFSQLNNITALPGSRGALIMVCPGGCSASGMHLAAVDFEADTTRVLMEDVLRGWYVPSRHLMYVRGDGAVFAAPFDLGSLKLTGTGIPLFEGVATTVSSPELAVVADGTVLYREGAAVVNRRELVWVDRNGEAERVDPDMDTDLVQTFALAPDDSSVALTGRLGTGAGPTQLWVKQLPDGPMTRLTNDPGATQRPAWSPDGRTIAYTTNEGTWHARSVPADGSSVGGFDVLLRLDGGVQEVEYAPDGPGLLVRHGAGAEADVGFLDVATDSVPADILASEFVEVGASLSPDGRWIAYTSNVSGQNEVYVRPFPSAEFQEQVSVEGGFSPVWGHRGPELFFIGGTPLGLHVATYRVGSTLQVEARRRLFDMQGYFVRDQDWRVFDVTQDDERFLIIRNVPSAEQPDATSFIYIQNFFEELKGRVGR